MQMPKEMLVERIREVGVDRNQLERDVPGTPGVG
jgi:hypothetical protein